jgi:hypothetical protein
VKTDVREVAACCRTSLVDHAQIPIQEDARVIPIAEHSARRIGPIRVGVHSSHLIDRQSEIACNRGNIFRSYVNDRVTATIGTTGAIGSRLDLVRKDQEWADWKVASFDVPPEIEVVRLLGFSPATNFGQIRDHH